MSEKRKRERRSSQTIHDLILSAARTLFAERGYRASTRDIAALAGVSETLIFRRFGSKARLFETVLSEPLIQFYETFESSHPTDQNDPRALAERGEIFMREIFAVCSRNRELIFAYLSAREFEPEVKAAGEGLDAFFAMTETSLAHRYELLGLTPSMPVQLVIRLGFVTILGVVLFRSWIFRDIGMDDEELLNHLDRFVLPDFPALGRHAPQA
jgi:AcrR family transcriptional regulator